MDCEGLRVREGLDGDVELRMGTEITASMPQIRSFEERGVGQRLFVSFKAVSIYDQFSVT